VANCRGFSPVAELAAIVAATIRLIELVGPKTWCRDEKKREPTNPPITTEAMTGVGGRFRMSEKPMAWGMDTSVTVAPAIKSARNFSHVYERSSAKNGRRTRNMCWPIAATSSVSSVTLSIGKVSYCASTRASVIFRPATIRRGAFNRSVTLPSRVRNMVDLTWLGSKPAKTKTTGN
jgi:hypothetical protein